MAEVIDKGKILYVDVWDMKQPGIFLVFLDGLQAVRLHDARIKLLELAWMLTSCGE